MMLTRRIFTPSDAFFPDASQSVIKNVIKNSAMFDPPWHNGQFGIQSWVDFDRVKKQKGQNKMCNHLHFYMAKDIKTGQQSNFH